MKSKENPILFSAPEIRATQAGTKTQTRRVIKPQQFIYGLTDDRIYGNLIANSEVINGRNEADSNIAEQRLHGWSRWQNIFSNEIQRIWEEGVRGLVSVKRPRNKQGLSIDISLPQQQKNHSHSTSPGLHGLSRDAAEAILSGETFGWQPQQQQTRESSLGDSAGKLARQESPRARERRGETPDVKTLKHRMRTFKVGNQKRIMQPASCRSYSRNVAGWHLSYCPFQVGQILWVREAWAAFTPSGNKEDYGPGKRGPEDLLTAAADHISYDLGEYDYDRWLEEAVPIRQSSTGIIERVSPIALIYRASGKTPWHGGWKPSIHMPRWASRVTLEVVSVWVERVQEISVADCIAEGVDLKAPLNDRGTGAPERDTFAEVWDSIYRKGKTAGRYKGPHWETNPYVWVIGFKVIEGDN